MKDVYVVISQILGVQYTLHGVYEDKEKALSAIGAAIKDRGFTTDHDALDRDFTEVGRWIHEGDPVMMYTLHEEPVTK